MFRIGDKVICISNQYRVTNKYAVCKVVQVALPKLYIKPIIILDKDKFYESALKGTDILGTRDINSVFSDVRVVNAYCCQKWIGDWD